MFWDRLLARVVGPSQGDRMRAEHSAWLTHMLATGAKAPRIPLRPASSGGFGPMMTRPTGQSHARAWWRLALEKVPL